MSGGTVRESRERPTGFQHLNRRGFLALTAAGLGTVALAGCRSDDVPSRAQSKDSGAVIPGPATIDELLSLSPFYIAHRGSGDNWVEHTLDAYSRAVADGAEALEVSVHSTSDGVLVCHHDRSLRRLTGTDRVIGEMTWAELSTVMNDDRAWLGPRAALQPIPRLDSVLAEFAADHVIFIEDKQGTNTRALLDALDGYQQSTKHFVWKQWAGADQHRAARKRGYRTWGYFTSQLLDRVEELASEFDYLGVHHLMEDAEIERVVAQGKPVIAWEVHYRSMRDRMVALGVAGMMCANLPYVTSRTSAATADDFASGLRSAGDLPWTTDMRPALQPVIDAGEATVSLADDDIQSYLMGSMSPIKPERRIISFELRWPDALPDPTLHAGIAFGAEDDRPYRVRIAGSSAGYHLILRANGSMELFRRSAGVAEGTVLKTIETTAPVPGEWVRMQVEVRETVVGFYRLDGIGWGQEVDDATHRGGYLWLCKNYQNGPRVQFRGISSS